MTTWLRRNAVALIAIAALIPVYIASVVMPRYREYWTDTRPEPPAVTVALGEVTDIEGVSWKVSDLRREHVGLIGLDSDVPLPDGHEAIRILWDRRAGKDARVPSGCDATLISGDIRWDTRDRYGWDPAVEVAEGPDGTTSVCSDPDVYQQGFLVPSGMHPDAVDVVVRFGPDGPARTVRFLL